MTYRLIFPSSYDKQARKFLKRHPQLIGQYHKTLQLLSLNPHHNSLRLHALKGILKGCHSVSINMKYRIILELIIKDDVITLVDIGSHDEVY